MVARAGVALSVPQGAKAVADSPLALVTELHPLLLHQLFAVVKALEDPVPTQLAPSGWLLGIPDNKLLFKTCGLLHSAPGWYLSWAIPSFPPEPPGFQFLHTASMHISPHTAVNTGKTMGLCCEMKLTTFKSMSNQPGAACLPQNAGTARKLRIEISHPLKINRKKIP